MKITISNLNKADKFIKLFQQIKSLTDCINIQLQPDKLYIQSIDSSRVSIFELYLPKEWFDEYDVTETTEMGVYTLFLNNVLQTRDSQESVILYNTHNSDKLGVTFISTNSSIQKEFVLPLFDLDCEIMTIPSMEYDVSFVVDGSLFSDNMKQLKMFGSDIMFQCNNDSIILCNNDHDKGNMSVSLPKVVLTDYVCSKPLQMSFSATKLSEICSFHRLNSNMLIYITDNNPLHIVIEIDPEYSNARIVFYVAPLVE